MMTALVLALAIGFQTPSTVTYTGEAKPVGVALQEISKGSGLHLKAGPEADREIVLISVTNMPLQNFLDRLATVTSCRWDRSDDGFTLKPDDAQRSREVEAEAVAHTKQVAQEIDKFTKGGNAELARTAAEASPGGTVTVSTSTAPAAPRDQAKGPSDPGEKVLAQFLSQVDPADIAAIGPGERQVWATNSPTSTQKSLAAGSADLITDWIQKHNEATSKSKDLDAQAEQIVNALPKELVDEIKRQTRPVTNPPAKALLSIKRSGLLGSVLGLQVALTAYDRQGEPLIDTQTMLSSGLQALIQRYTGKPTAPATQPEKKTPIAYSDDTKALIEVFGAINPSNPFKGVPTALRAKLQHPDARDPLAYVATDQLMALAKSDGAQLIADLPDKSFGFGSGITDLGKAATTVEEVQRNLDGGQTIKGSVEDGCLTVRPADPVENRRTRVDRSALATLLGAVIAKHQPSLDDLCAYALANEPRFSNPIATIYCQFFAPSLAGSGLTAGAADWNMLRFYGVLTQVQRQNLRAGGTLSLGDLNGAQRNYAAAVLFGADAKFRNGSDAGSKDVVSRMILMFAGGSGNGGLDPTELMPNGLSSSAFLSCSATDESIIQAQDADGKSDALALSPTDLAMIDMVKGFPGAGNIASYLPSKGLVGHRTVLDFVFHVGAGAMDQTLLDASVPADAQEVDMKSLPPDLQAQVDKQKADLKKSPLGLLSALPMFHQAPPP